MQSGDRGRDGVLLGVGQLPGGSTQGVSEVDGDIHLDWVIAICLVFI